MWCEREQESTLLILIAQKRVGSGLGRIEPRAVKQSPQPFPLLMVPRPIAREIFTKKGHPKSLSKRRSHLTPLSMLKLLLGQQTE